MEQVPDIEWMDGGACRNADPSYFFPERFTPGMRQIILEAKRICNGCAVRDTCRDHAIKFEPFGVWGGMTERERRDFRAKNRIVMSNLFSRGVK